MQKQIFTHYLPDDILYRIIQYLDSSDIISFKNVCQASQLLIKLFFNNNSSLLISKLLEELSDCKIDELQNDHDHETDNSKIYDLYLALNILKKGSEKHYLNVLQLINYPNLTTPQAIVTFNLWVKRTASVLKRNDYILESFLHAENLYTMKPNFFTCLNLANHYSILIKILTFNSVTVLPEILYEKSFRAGIINGLIKCYTPPPTPRKVNLENVFSICVSRIQSFSPHIQSEILIRNFTKMFINLHYRGLIRENGIEFRQIILQKDNDVKIKEVIDLTAEALMYISDNYYDIFLLLEEKNKVCFIHLLLNANLFDLLKKIASITLNPEYTDNPRNLLTAFDRYQKSWILNCLSANFSDEITQFKLNQINKFSTSLTKKLSGLLLASQIIFAKQQIIHALNNTKHYWILNKFPLTFEQEIEDISAALNIQQLPAFLNTFSSKLLIYPGIESETSLKSMWIKYLKTLMPNEIFHDECIQPFTKAALLLTPTTISNLCQLRLPNKKLIQILSLMYISDTCINNFCLKLKIYPIFAKPTILTKGVIEHLLTKNFNVTENVAKQIDSEEQVNTNIICYLFELFGKAERSSNPSYAFEIIYKFGNLQNLDLMCKKKLRQYFDCLTVKQPWFLMLTGNEILRLNSDCLNFLQRLTAKIQKATITDLKLLFRKESYIVQLFDLMTLAQKAENEEMAQIITHAKVMNNISVSQAYFFQVQSTPDFVEPEPSTINSKIIQTEEPEIITQANTSESNEKSALINHIEFLRVEIKRMMDAYRLGPDEPEAKRQKFDNC